jgi:hypothetical protein
MHRREVRNRVLTRVVVVVVMGTMEVYIPVTTQPMLIPMVVAITQEEGMVDIKEVMVVVVVVVMEDIVEGMGAMDILEVIRITPVVEAMEGAIEEMKEEVEAVAVELTDRMEALEVPSGPTTTVIKGRLLIIHTTDNSIQPPLFLIAQHLCVLKIIIFIVKIRGPPSKG